MKKKLGSQQEKTQMESIHFGQNGDCSNSTRAKISLPPDCDNCPEPEVPPQVPSDSHDMIDDIFGEPEVSLRVGDEYQAKIPTPVKSQSRKPGKYETQICPDHILLGHPILLTWINTLKNHALGPSSKTMKMEALDELHGFPTLEKIRRRGGPGYNLVPGLASFSWNALEKDSLILGLYIFKKDFVLVKRLVATKNMGSVLSFYYCHFYHSSEYRRWSQWRKRKSKKINGQRIFSGARQQELLNRILVGVSEEHRNDILEASKMFGEDQMSLSDYVFSLVLMVGIETLVNAIGIGKGKLDLTEMPLESSRSKSTRTEIPTGKALASLTTDEIVKILSGNYRLSKARANDIFWEAVWPLLLGRGWHSEQPNNQRFANHCLVFLSPGIKKFSRRKLVKGDHYFDSVTDILSKVVKEPELINLKSQEEVGFGGKNEQSEISPNEKNSEKETHCYLQPRTPNRNTDVVKFMVVDTSLLDGKVRGLRSFPSEISVECTGQDLAEDNGGERSGGSNCADVAMLDEPMADDIDGKTTTKSDSSIPDLKKDSNRTKKVLKSRKAAIRDSRDQVGPLTKRFSMSNRRDQEDNKDLFPGVCEVLPANDKTPATAGASGDGLSENVENARPPPLLIDLNLPRAPPEPENEELSREQDRGPNGQPWNLNPRRLSTRYRPPTLRTMQAVADGYLAVSQKRKRTPKRTGGVLVGVSNPPDTPAAPHVEVGENGSDNSGNSTISG